MTDNKIERQVVIDSSKIIGNIGYGVKIKCEKELSKVKQSEVSLNVRIVYWDFTLSSARPSQ